MAILDLVRRSNQYPKDPVAKISAALSSFEQARTQLQDASADIDARVTANDAEVRARREALEAFERTTADKNSALLQEQARAMTAVEKLTEILGN